MDLFEYQAKKLFEKHGVPVTAQRVVTSPDAAAEAARALGTPVVVKAQVKVGGRGKAGGVRLASSPEEARQHTADILGLTIKGHPVHTVVVTEACRVAEEYYLAFLLDRSERTLRALVSREGGVDVEEVAATRPDALVSVPVSATRGFDDAQARDLWQRAGLPEDLADEASHLLRRLWWVLTDEDATLVEVNPLVRTEDGHLVALDGKVTLDDNAAYRHEDHASFADVAGGDGLEATARAKGLNYVKLDGEVGIIGNGAGLVMSTLDVVAYAGEEHGVRPANFLDIGGGASAQVMADALSVLMADPGVRSVLVNVFGGITQCDAVAEGIVRATRLLDSEDGSSVDRPLVVRLDGNNAEEGRRVLADAGIPAVRSVETMDAAAALAAELAGQGG